MGKKILFITFLVLFVFLFKSPVNAANLWLDPSTGTAGQNSTLKVNIGVNTAGESVNAVQANIVYPLDKLQFTNISTGGSALTIIAEKTAGNGVVRLAGGTPTPGFTGSKYLATIYFKVLGNSGVAELSFSDDSVVIRDSDNSNTLSGKGTASFTMSAKSETETPSFVDDKSKQLTISEVKVLNISKNTASVTWKTNVETTSVVEYGLSPEYKFISSSEDLVLNHSVDLDSSILLPGSTYHIRVSSQDASGNEVFGEDIVFSTLGYPIVVQVADSNGKSLVGAEVNFHSGGMSGVTDKNGVVLFDSVSPGKHGLVIKHKNRTRVEEVVVVESNKPQIFKVVFPQLSVFSNIIATVFGNFKLLIAIVALVFIVTIFLSAYLINKGNR